MGGMVGMVGVTRILKVTGRFRGIKIHSGPSVSEFANRTYLEMQSTWKSKREPDVFRQ